MHYLISKLLDKRGIKDVKDLTSDPMPDGSPSERATIEQWDRVLSAKESVTVDDIKQFCKSQVSKIESQWKDLDNKTVKNERLVLLHTVYKAILEVIDAPQTQRETLERYLKSLL